MRIGLAAAFAVASMVAIGSAQAQETTACDTKFDELLKKLAERTMPAPQRADYNAELLGSYQSCKMNKDGAWTGIENKINA